MPVQLKNWFTLLSVYWIVLFPSFKIPVFPNPIAESTVIVFVEDAVVKPITFVLGVILNSPSIKLLSS